MTDENGGGSPSEHAVTSLGNDDSSEKVKSDKKSVASESER